MPANVLFIQDILNQIVNFQIIDKDMVNNDIIEPIFGKKEESKGEEQDEEKEEDGEEE